MTAGGAIEVFDPAVDDEAIQRAVAAFLNRMELELYPEDPVTPLDKQLESWANPPADTTYHRRVVWDAQRAAVTAYAALPLGYFESNRHLAQLSIHVHPDHRRRRTGSRLFAALARVAQADGRTVLALQAEEDTAGAAFLAAAGGECKLVDRKSSLDVTQLDRAMLEGWVAHAKDRAAGYSLVWFDGRCPDELLDDWMDITLVMNTAPKSEEVEDWVANPARFRDDEARWLAQGYESWQLLARRDDDGACAGFTSLSFAPYVKDVAWQGGTAVRPDHRNLGLGRWLKAAMALRLLDERPAVRRVDTFNAVVNEPMLNINIAMGFRLVRKTGEWFVPVDAGLETVDRRLAG